MPEKAVSAKYLAMLCVMPTTKEMMDEGLLDSLIPKVFQDIIVTMGCKDEASLLEDCDKVFLPIISYKTNLAKLIMAKANDASMNMNYYSEESIRSMHGY